MSRQLSDYEYRPFFELGDMVYFDHYGIRLCGEVVRTYNGNPCALHVEVEGQRYEVDTHEDKVRRDE